MKKVTVFEAADGKQFTDAKKCAEYESTSLARTNLEKAIAEKLARGFKHDGETAKWYDACGFAVIEQKSIAKLMNAILDNKAAVIKALSGGATKKTWSRRKKVVVETAVKA